MYPSDREALMSTPDQNAIDITIGRAWPVAGALRVWDVGAAR